MVRTAVLLLTFLLTFLSFQGTAQNRHFRVRNSNHPSFEISLGSSHLLGDLGGGHGIGENNIGDLNLKATRSALSCALVMQSTKPTVFKAGITYITLHSSDEYTTSLDRRERGLRSFTQLVEPSFIMEQQITRLQGNYTRNGSYWFATAGLAAAIYSASVEYIETGPHNGVVPPDRGVKTSLVIPVGISYKYYFKWESSIGFDVVGRKTFSDLIDGTEASYGGTSEKRTMWGTGDGAVKDHYFTFMITYRTGLN